LKEKEAVLKQFAVAAILCGSAMAQDAKTVITNAQKALGDVKSITYSGSAKDVSFQQCGANATQMVCQGTHDPMRPIAAFSAVRLRSIHQCERMRQRIGPRRYASPDFWMRRVPGA
jgi:hypothetical protein